MTLSYRLPAWLLQLMPATLARKWIFERGLPALPTNEATRQLLIDVSVIYFGDACTGIQRVVRNTYRKLLDTPPPGYRVCPIVATRNDAYRHVATNFLDEPPSNLNAGPSVQLVKVGMGDIYLGLDLAAHIVPYRTSELLCWKARGVRFFFYMYDLLPVLEPDWFNPNATKNFKRWLRVLAIMADEIICISYTVQKEFSAWIQREYGLPADSIKCSVIPLGVDTSALTSKAQTPAGASRALPEWLKNKFVLMVGTIEPRKGHEEILIAFEKLWAAGETMNLVIAGKQGWKMEPFIKHLKTKTNENKHLCWLEGPPDEILLQLYQTSSGLIMASKGEGFGLPLIEAAYFNKPVFARDIPIFREVAVGNVSFFSNESGTDICESLINWIRSLSDGGPTTEIENKKFSTWQESSGQVVSLITKSSLRLKKQTAPT